MERGKDTTWNGRSCDAVVNNSTVYCRYDTNHVYGVGHAYVPTTYIPSSSWPPVPDCPHSGFALAVIDGLLTAVGGWGGDCKNTNKLLSLTGKGSGREWTEKFPPMPAKHYVSALCTGATLIVASLGGVDDNYHAETENSWSAGILRLDSSTLQMIYLNHCHGHH